MPLVAGACRCCLFVTGLTRASVRLLAVSPADCSWQCVVVPVATLSFLVMLLVGATIDLLRFLRQHSTTIEWKPSARVAVPDQVVDVWMRLRAKARVNVLGVRLVASKYVVDVVPTEVSRRVSLLARTSVQLTSSVARLSRRHGTSARVAVDDTHDTIMNCAVTDNVTTREAVTDEVQTESPDNAPCTAKVEQLSTTTSSRSVKDALAGEHEPVTGRAAFTGTKRLPQRAKEPRQRPSGRLSLVQARAEAAELIETRGGHRDRKSGAFIVPVDDTLEPERTERLLAAPFALRRTRAADAFQSREGFFMFRVNGSSCVGRWYRLIVVSLNMSFGVLSGLQPLLNPDSAEATAQTMCVMALQLSMSLICWWVLPDADRIISHFAGMQFLLEGLSTGALLGANSGRVPSSASTFGVTNSSASSIGVNDSGGVPPVHGEVLFEVGFVLSLLAMVVPMLQLLEQRFVTPMIGVVMERDCSPLALLAAFYILVVGLPRRLGVMLGAIEGQNGLDAGVAAGSASADAGDEVDAGGDYNASDEDFTVGEDGCHRDAAQVGAVDVDEAAVKVSRLLARGIAAKEVNAKEVSLPLNS